MGPELPDCQERLRAGRSRSRARERKEEKDLRARQKDPRCPGRDDADLVWSE